MSRNNADRLLMRDLGANSAGRVLTAFLSATPVLAVPSFAFAQDDARVTAREALATDSFRPREFNLGDNPVRGNGGLLTTLNVEGTMSVLAPTTADWAENELRATLRVMNGYVATGELNTASDASIVSEIQGLLAAAPQLAGRPDRVEITQLLISKGYAVDSGTQVFLQTVTPGISQRYRAGTQGAGNTTGVQGIEIPAGFDSLAVRAAGGGRPATAVRVTIVRNVGGRIEVSETDMYDWCANGFSVPEAPAITAPVAVEAGPAHNCLEVELNNAALIAAGARIIEGNAGALRIARRENNTLSPTETAIVRECAALTYQASGNLAEPCPDCDREGQTAYVAGLVFNNRRTGLADTEDIRMQDYRVAMLARLRLVAQSDGNFVFAVPPPPAEGHDKSVYYHPAWCEEIEIGGVRYRLELQSEENLAVLRRASEPGNRLRLDMSNPNYVWEAVSGSRSGHRFNFRGGRMVEDRNWSGGSRNN